MSDLLLPDVPIIDSSNAHLFVVNGGYDGRDFNAVPVGSVPCAPLTNLPTIPRSDWAGMIEEGEAKKTFLTHLQAREEVGVLYQGNTLFCSTNAVIGAYHITAAKQGIEKSRRKRISSASVACRITNFQNKGHWPIQSVELMSKLGGMPEEDWGPNAIDPSLDKGRAHNAIRSKYMIDESTELPPRDFEHLMSAVLRRHATPASFMWMKHTVCAFAPKQIGADAFAIWCLNSHGASAGHGGYMLIAEDMAKPDEAISIRSVKPY